MRNRFREKEESAFPAVMGASSLLVIFSVLCLTVFSLLSLSTVSANHRIADDNSKALQAYYEADSEANAILAQIRNGNVPQGVSVSAAGGSEGSSLAGGRIYEYSCRVSDTQVLCVKAEVSGKDFRILRWQTVTDYDWQPNTDLPVWTP